LIRIAGACVIHDWLAVGAHVPELGRHHLLKLVQTLLTKQSDAHASRVVVPPPVLHELVTNQALFPQRVLGERLPVAPPEDSVRVLRVRDVALWEQSR
jgi:hypothetical protein